MGRTLRPNERKLCKRIDEVLHYLWDPIGVAGVPTARDEYLSYVPQVFKLLLYGAGRDQIAEYLVIIETEIVGMSPNHAGAQAAAEVLMEWRDWIAYGPS